VIFAAIASTVVTQIMVGTGPTLPLLLPHLSTDAPLTLLPSFLVLGALLGLVGVALNRSILWAMDFSARSQKRAPYVYPAVVGLLSGALLVLSPMTVTGGENVILDLASQNSTITLLLMLGAIRFVTMVGGYSSGVPGGVFAPILALACCLGLAFGQAMALVLPDSGMAPLAFAIVAMGGLFTASVRAPIVGVALTLEITGSYALVMPLMATCVTASLIAQWCGGRPLYTELLERTLRQAGLKPPPEREEPTGLA
jgi:CIC family chloride channel protein